HFSLPSHTESTFTASSAFKNWKKVTFKDGGLASHSRTEHHRDAMMTWKEFETSEKKQESLIGNLNKKYNKKVKENRDNIKKLAEVLLYTAPQNIGQRGHNETIESDRKGNFLEMLCTSIIKEVMKSEVFSILADETNDLSKKEQISFVVRYYYNGVINKKFFYNLNRLNTNMQKDRHEGLLTLEKYGLEY
ncbi:hypothetical protein Z043_125263, partial [Scleropages formosus]